MKNVLAKTEPASSCNLQSQTYKFASVAKQYEKNPELKKDDVTQLLNWIGEQPHLPKMTEFETILFLQSCRFSKEAAKTAIDNYYTMRTQQPDWFMNRNPSDPEFRKTLDVTLFTALPKTTPEGYTIFLAKLVNPDPRLYIFPLQVKLFDMVFSAYLYKYGTMKGMRVVLDMEGGTFRHLMKISINQCKKSIHYVQEAAPVKLVTVHYIHISSLMDKVMFLMKPFLKKEIIELIHIHSNLETLFDFIPKECLPEEYGGKGSTIPLLHDDMKRLLDGATVVFKREETMVVDETKRPNIKPSK